MLQKERLQITRLIYADALLLVFRGDEVDRESPKVTGFRFLHFFQAKVEHELEEYGVEICPVGPSLGNRPPGGGGGVSSLGWGRTKGGEGM